MNDPRKVICGNPTTKTCGGDNKPSGWRPAAAQTPIGGMAPAGSGQRIKFNLRRLHIKPDKHAGFTAGQPKPG